MEGRRGRWREEGWEDGGRTEGRGEGGRRRERGIVEEQLKGRGGKDKENRKQKGRKKTGGKKGEGWKSPPRPHPQRISRGLSGAFPRWESISPQKSM